MRRGAELRVAERGDPFCGPAEDRDVARVEGDCIQEIGMRWYARTLGGADCDVRQVELPRLEEVRLDLLARVIGHDSVLERLDDDAECLELLLVALELAAHRLAGPVVALEPVALVVVHLAEDLFARDRISSVEKEGEEVEPALGFGHAEMSSRSCAITVLIPGVSDVGRSTGS